LKPEQWGSRLVQEEKYQEEEACDKRHDDDDDDDDDSIQFNSHLLMCQLNSTVANYKASTK
jgi:hypothetical protein